MKEFVISNKEAGQRMDKYLFKVLNQAPKSFVYKMLRKKNIVLNDKKAAGTEVLNEKDSIKIYLADDTFDKFASGFEAPKANQNQEKKQKSAKSPKQKVSLDIVYEDDDILVINKPVGVLSQKAQPGDYSANEMVIDYLLESGSLTKEELRTFHPSVCNRLDRNTSGLLIAGKTIRGLQQMAEYLKSRDLKKYYQCIVLGHIDKGEHLTGYLVKNEGTNQVHITKEKPASKDAAYIETSYEPVEYYGNLTLLKVHLITGRSHQIRAHLSSIGHPILGDPKYGKSKVNQAYAKATGQKGQLLHAFEMVFPDGKTITAPVPNSFAQAKKWALQQKEKR